MPDRLQQLLRQRALLQEHLAWLDREIAEASGAATPPVAPIPIARATQEPLVVPTPATPPSPTIAPSPPAKSFATGQAAQILATAATVATSRESGVPAAVDAVAEQIIEQYRPGLDTTKTDVRKGCLLYFFAAFALLALGVGALYFYFERGR